MRTFISLIIVSMLLVGCSKDDSISNGEVPDQPGNTGEENYNFPEPVNVTSYDQADEYASQVDEAFIDAQMEFAFETLKKIDENNIHGRNIVYSPLSTSVALTMLYNGAVGETKRTLHNILHFDKMTSGEVNQQYRKLLLSLSRCDTNINLGLANALWVSMDLEVNQRFVAKNRAYLLAQTPQVDFMEPTTLTRMNEWTAGKTYGNIHKLITRDMDDFSGVALDAFSLDGKWTIAFNNSWNEIDEFTTATGGTKMVEFMRTIGRDYTYLIPSPNNAGLPNGKAVRIPYGRGKIAMYIFLPDEYKELDDVLTYMSPDYWKRYQSNFIEYPNLWGPEFNYMPVFELPKFKVDYTYHVEEIFGIKDAFINNNEFNAISESVPLNIAYKQKSYVEVNEAGIQVEEQGNPEDFITQGVPFDINRPFFFLIQDDRTSTILQMGIVRYP
ncbi:MAG: hypothetical protein K9I94_06740 [Bacteroidales bacterium]|nr:hypothetical protein [Bacteroidales bacterium]